MFADGGKWEIFAGANVLDYTLGYSSLQTQDVELSIGIGGYFILGGGVSFNLNVSEFIRIWNED